MKELLIPVSVGELLDKITILEIKAQCITEPARQANVQRELATLKFVQLSLAHDHGHWEPMMLKLKMVNRQLWNVEDDIRDCESRGEFGERFVELARSIYKLNDERARTQEVN